uniref:polycomb group RING finger protein 1 n=1 Tax=Ciona intestinalis TaxID=7719 RepID=UPI000180B17D|nr:polycomb group RING finger protein 1 [Ciona intestinalis]|eukprot:XP_002130076.1 polycomb group RING finger protein 1 [Ciona intestinalis]
MTSVGNDKPVLQDSDLILKIRTLNPHIVCALCAGYFIDATTISECSHTFCKSCIVKHLQTKKSCPECSQKIHETQPLMNLRSDRVMQDVVYKLVPNLFQAEQQREAEFYRSRGVDFSLSGSHLLNIGTPLKYTQQKVLRDTSDLDVPKIDARKIPNVHIAHRYKFDEKLYFQLMLDETMLPYHDGGLIRFENLTFKELPKYIRCPGRATVWHIEKIIASQLRLGSEHVLQLSCCGRDLDSSTGLKQITLMSYYSKSNAGFENQCIPIMKYKVEMR